MCHNSTKTTYWGHHSLKIFWEQFSDKQSLIIILPVVKLCADESSSKWMVTTVDVCSSLFMEWCRKSAHQRDKHSQDRNYDWTKSVRIYKANSYLEINVLKESESDSVVSDSLQPHGLYSPWKSPGQNTGVGKPFPCPGDLPNLGIEPRSPVLQADSLPAEPQGKPKNIGVGSLSLLQQIFLTQESNRGLLHCRRIFYQLN